MLRIRIDINGHVIHEVRAVRVFPVDRVILQGELCKYECSYFNDDFSNPETFRFQYPYGDGLSMAATLLVQLVDKRYAKEIDNDKRTNDTKTI